MKGTAFMARPKAKAKAKGRPAVAAPPPQGPRTMVINLKGSQEQSDWLKGVHRKTHISKAIIVRLALALWAERSGHEPFSTAEDET